MLDIRRATGSSLFLVLLASILFPLAACAGSPATPAPSPTPIPAPAQGAYWPTQGWRVSTPEAQGMESAKLAEMLAAIGQQRLDLDSILIIRNGYVVSETYLEPYNQDTTHDLYSVTKSFVSTLIGIAMDQGKIERTDQRILDFFPGRTIENLDPQKQAMTLEDVLTMRSGLDWQEGDAAYSALYQSQDWVSYMLDLPLAAPPGSKFNYCSGCSHVLSAILQQTTGRKTRDFAEQTLFKPLGIRAAAWETDPAGISFGGWGLKLTPRDMAKLGYLYLRDGRWDGQQIVSAEWVKNATREHTGTGGSLGYGYQWWTYPSLKAYAALGHAGQTIFVIPESDLVIVTTAQLDNHDPIFKLVEQYIVPAVRKSQ